MKTTFLTTALLTLISSFILAKNPTKIEDENGIAKNTATFSTSSMVATIKYDNINLLTLSLNKTSTEKVKLSITKNGISIFSDSYTNIEALNKGYDLSELPKGKYFVVITQGNQKFEKQIEKIFDVVLEIE